MKIEEALRMNIEVYLEMAAERQLSLDTIIRDMKCSRPVASQILDRYGYDYKPGCWVKRDVA
jgi:hypothetical protein